MVGTGMQVDGMGASGSNLPHEDIRQLGGKRTFIGTREKTVEIPPVRRIPAVLHESIDIHNRHRQQGSPDSIKSFYLHQVVDDFRADDLVAVHRGTDKQARARLPSMYDMDRQEHFRVGVEARHRKAYDNPLPGLDSLIQDGHWCLHGDAPPKLTTLCL